MLARLVIVRPKDTMRYRYVEVLQAESKRAVNEALLEIVTRPGFVWLEPENHVAPASQKENQ